jgi:hypothetical protein
MERFSQFIVLQAFITALIPVGSASGAPLFVQTEGGGFGGILGNTPAAISWTQADTWTNVEISLELFNRCGEHPFLCTDGITGTGRAYLTDSIGAGTTQGANEIAATAISTTTPGSQIITAFSGLTLGPGTYYVIYSYGAPLNLGWLMAASPIQVAGDGVTPGPTSLYLGDLTGAYEPSEQPFEVVRDQYLMFNISGTRVDEIPEPSLLFLSGVSVCGALARRTLLRHVCRLRRGAVN